MNVTQVKDAHPSSPTPLTRQQLLTQWPGNPPREDSLWRTLTRACEQGLLTKTGEGTKVDAFRYGVVKGEVAAGTTGLIQAQGQEVVGTPSTVTD